MKTEPHEIRDEDERGNLLDRTLAWVHPASRDAVATVLAAVEGDLHGRSEPVWLRLSNGDLILGVFPRGETYFAVEQDAQYPSKAEGPTMCDPRVRFVIVAEIDGERLYWSNDNGWGTFTDATRFTETERHAFNLPMQGEWRKVQS